MSSELGTLEALHSKRRRWVEAEKQNGFNTRQILSDLYPDQAHFIFELLQNAEDAQAYEVHFELTPEGLAFTHNGKRPFTAGDVDGITSIANNGKKDAVNQIGKFGVGFKAVFAYTDTPRIRSGAFHFEIQDLVCPVPLPEMAQDARLTRFELPFNRPEKSAEQCFGEVEAVLTSLDDSVLLFLANIESIGWSVRGGEKGQIRRYAYPGNVISVERHHGQHAEVSNYLRYLKDVRIQKGAVEGVSFVGLAYALALTGDTPYLSKHKPLGEQARVVETAGNLCVFFPADKEATRLRFHLHGPFSATVARDSVKHADPGNQALIGELARLVAESLTDIQRKGLLDTSFLDVLPNPRDQLDLFYAPIAHAIIAEMRSKPLVPTYKGDFAPAHSLLQSTDPIKQVFDDSDIALLHERPGLRWTVNANRTMRHDTFLRGLGIDLWEATDVHAFFDRHFQHQQLPDSGPFSQWFRQKDAAWLAKLYAFLSRLGDLYRHRNQAARWAIIRTQEGAYLRGPQVYYPLGTGGTLNGLHLLDRDVLGGAQKQSGQNEWAKRFLDLAGVRVAGEREGIEAVLRTYYGDEVDYPGDEEHLAHMRQFIAWYRNGGDTEFFGPYHFLVDQSTDYLVSPEDALLDEPFRTTGLKNLVGTGRKQFLLWSAYEQVRHFAEFAESVGVVTRLPIELLDTIGNANRSRLTRNFSGSRETNTMIDEDYQIEGLEALLDKKHFGLSKLVWNTLCEAPRKFLRARYRPNQQHEVSETSSQLVQTLSEARWIPDKTGVFRSPQELTPDHLPAEFVYNDRNGWLTDIGLGETARKQSEAYLAKKRMAEHLNVDLETLDALASLSADTRQKIKALILQTKQQEREQKELPAAEPVSYSAQLSQAFNRQGRAEQEVDIPPTMLATQVSDRRRETVTAEIRESLNQLATVKTAFSSVKWQSKNEGTRAKLREAYHGRCQICGQSFAKYDGQPYFEGVYLVSRIQGGQLDRWGNVLCLCANHSAMFQHGTVSAENLEAQIRSFRLDGSDAGLIIRLSLCGKEVEMTFDARHLHDLQTLITESSNLS